MDNNQHETKYSYTLAYDIERDIWNWYYGANYSNNAEQLRSMADKKMADSIRRIPTLEEADPILRPFLKTKLDASDSELNQFVNIAKAQFAEKFKAGCDAIAAMTGHPLTTTNFTFFVTSFPRMVAFYDEGIIFLYSKIDDELWGMPMDGFLHELQHFQVDKYWRRNPNSPVSELNDDDYYKLKESLTVILDEELKPIITLPDCSYPEYKELRDALHANWKQYHDFGQLIELGLALLKQGL